MFLAFRINSVLSTQVSVFYWCCSGWLWALHHLPTLQFYVGFTNKSSFSLPFCSPAFLLAILSAYPNSSIHALTMTHKSTLDLFLFVQNWNFMQHLWFYSLMVSCHLKLTMNFQSPLHKVLALCFSLSFLILFFPIMTWSSYLLLRLQTWGIFSTGSPPSDLLPTECVYVLSFSPNKQKRCWISWCSTQLKLYRGLEFLLVHVLLLFLLFFGQFLFPWFCLSISWDKSKIFLYFCSTKHSSSLTLAMRTVTCLVQCR